jgi:K+-transporting ATPase ATPase C chain
MLSHLRATLLLLVATLILCCGVYPLALWAVGQTLFRDQAEGSLVRDKDGKVIGSRLIAQPFSGDEYFQPRPSAVSYNAAASGASNWAASNYLLRDRVARQLGPMVRYYAKSPTKPGQPVAADIEAWFQSQPPDYAARWAKDHPKLAGQWVKDHPEVVAAWLGKTDDDVKDNADDCAQSFFPDYVAKHPGTWPAVEEKTVDGKTEKKLQPARDGADVQSYLFDPWLQANPNVVLEQVPADLVMTSGSGLDPHITLKGALYQLDRVAAARAKKSGRSEAQVRQEIEALLKQKAAAPWGGLIGVPLVNVLEVNRELDHLDQR